MGAIFDKLQEALNARTESLSDISRSTGVDLATLSRIANGTRPSVSMATLETLAEYLGLELRPKARRRKS